MTGQEVSLSDFSYLVNVIPFSGHFVGLDAIN